MLSGMIMIEGLLFDRIQSDACGLAVNFAVKQSAFIYAHAAIAVSGIGYQAFMRAQTAADFLRVEFFVIEGFMHSALISGIFSVP